MNEGRILLINFGSKFFDLLYSKLLTIVPDIVTISDTKLGSLDLANFSGFILSGSPRLFVELDRGKFIENIKPVFDLCVPVLGICFGHQLMGLTFGANISKGKLRRGDEKIILLKESVLFKGLDYSFIQQEAHSEEITLPKCFNLIATSERTKVEAMRHNLKPFFGVEFHPELSGDKGMRILKNFVEFI